MTIRFRLGLSLALALMPVLVLGAVETYGAFAHDAEVRRASLTQAAQRSAVEARARIQSAVAILQTISPRSIGFECAPRLADVMTRLDGYSNLVRLDAQARVECAAASVLPAADRAQRTWFVRLKQGSRFQLAKARASQAPALVAAVRVDRPDGAFDGAFVAVMPLASLRPDMTDPSLPQGTAVALADDQGRLLLQTDAGAFANLPDDWTRRQAVFRARDAAGYARSLVAAPLVNAPRPEDRIFVLLSAPAPNVLSWARINPFASIILPLLMWAAAWLVVWVVADRIVVRWLAYLDRVAGLFARGRFSVRAIHAARAPREIRDLAQTMDSMAEAIEARDMALRDSLAQKDALMREIHHRVKNNLQVITSLLNMQQRALTDPSARAAIYDTRQRITALALIYRALYQSPDLRRVDVRQFLEELIASQIGGAELGRASNLRTELKADDLEVDPDKLAPIALFAVEAIGQARKHVFPPEGGNVRVRFTVAAEVVLEIEDDGAEPVDADAAGGVGRTLMSAYARQLRGRCSFDEGSPGLSLVRLTFPPPELAPAVDPGASDAATPGVRNQVAA